MKKLENLSLTRLSNLEFGQLLKSSCEGLGNMEGITITDEVLVNYLTILETKSVDYDKAQLQTTKSDETAKIVEADKQRDNAVTALFRILKVFELSEQPNELEAFSSLTNLFYNYKGIQNWNFVEETNGIDKLLTDLSIPKYNQHLNVLKMLPFAERLKTANDQFKLLFSGRTHEKANKEVFDIKLLRQEINKIYSDMTNYVLSLSKALDSEQYNRALTLINTTRKYYSDILARRTTKATTNTATVN
ncbi:DUF6261 family protein [Flavobacterium pectinovorum]|uniref:DUF6261 family protein n=1 Tax=Flavobacterium pectinovorum TaxID=29533 RepID=UPI001FAB4133|nr:DUF6261 family protein [Flavobacterium pectinovorum]MCI9846924.1 hypothetical protein [Flavobacterium pectinovorum]